MIGLGVLVNIYASVAPRAAGSRFESRRHGVHQASQWALAVALILAAVGLAMAIYLISWR